MLLFIFLSIISIIVKQQNFRTVCYLDEDNNPINIEWDDRLPFVPEDLDMSFETFANSLHSPIIALERKSIILRKTDSICENSLKYHVPRSTYPIITINIVIRWGDGQNVIDEFGVVLEPNFQMGFHSLEGLLGHSVIDILLMHQNPGQKFSTEKRLSYNMKKWNKAVRPVAQGESICLSFLTTEFSGILLLSTPPKLYLETKYYMFRIFSYSNQKRKILDEKKYLTQINPCYSSDVKEKKLKIFVDPDTYSIQIEMWESNVGPLINRYHVVNGQLNTDGLFDDLNFEKWDIHLKPVTRDMVGQDLGLLLYGHTIRKKQCRATVLERRCGLELSFSFKKKVGDVVLESYAQIMDMATNSLGVYKLKRASQFDLTAC